MIPELLPASDNMIKGPYYFGRKDQRKSMLFKKESYTLTMADRGRLEIWKRREDRKVIERKERNANSVKK